MQDKVLAISYSQQVTQQMFIKKSIPILRWILIFKLQAVYLCKHLMDPFYMILSSYIYIQNL